MQSWAILSHSAKMVINNLNVAVRLAIPLIGAMVLSLLLFGQDVFNSSTEFSFDVETDEDLLSGFEVGFASLIQAIAALWVAVAWHRYILLEEEPQGILPTFHVNRVLAYFGWGLLLAIIIGVIATVVGGIGAILISFGGIGGLLGGAVITVMIVFIIYFASRVYVILPSAAIGQTLSLSQAWAATRGYGGSIIVAYIFFIIAAIIGGLVVGLISALLGFVGTLMMMALNLALIMFGMSFLTTIYGITVENREI